MTSEWPGEISNFVKIKKFLYAVQEVGEGERHFHVGVEQES